jgi:hypothetical protein
MERWTALVIVVIIVVAAIALIYGTTPPEPQGPLTEDELMEQLESELDTTIGEGTQELEDLLDTI